MTTRERTKVIPSQPVTEGAASIGQQGEEAPPRAATLLGEGDKILVRAGEAGTRFLLLAAKPLNEPVTQYGPFVMNTREEIEQALADYRDGTLAGGLDQHQYFRVTLHTAFPTITAADGEFLNTRCKV